MLARREHSRSELTLKLKQKGHSPAAIAGSLARLEQEHWQSDARFCEALIAARRRRGSGPVRIRQELQNKGIPAELIEAHLDLAAREWLEVLAEVRQKKFGSAPPASSGARAREMRFLLYRGFTAEQIQRVLNVRDGD